MVRHLVEQGWLSERKACRVIGVSRTGIRHESLKPAKDQLLKEALLQKATQYPRYGYLMLQGLLKQEGLFINRKRTYRLYTACSLQVRTKKRKKLAGGRRLRVLSVVDDFTRECIGQLTDLSISGQWVAQFLNQLIASRGKPRSITCDNGTEFTSKAMFFWSKDHRVRLQFIQPVKPTQNAFVESLNGKFRDRCVNQYGFRSLDEAKQVIDEWRMDYNEIRPHSSLGYQPPNVLTRAVT